jgi:hypothetical protein
MKKVYIFLILLFLGGLSIQAQQQCGFYRTVSDFRKQQISIPVNSKYGKKAIQVSDFFLRPYVYIRTEQGKTKVHEDNVYAICDYKGNIYRIWNRKAYQLADTEYLQIYSYTYTGKVKKQTSRCLRFENKQMTDYYFSENDSSEIYPLTLTNVTIALLENKKLDRKLVKNFPDNQSLQIKNTNQFSINNFLKNSK